ncbi:MAG: hypothetical protein HXY26_07275 [Hydrogenophilaceae bacterium]|nr:hypothetical protein [Hydrogenophilaceae bacterium]
MIVECYAQRLLNPFRGVVQIIRYASAEAVSMDGLHWDIYVSNDELLRGLELGTKVQTSDIRYGSWTLAKGLRRGPLYPSDDFLRMEAMGAIVYQHLLSVHNTLPFDFRDRYELWLLDVEGQPLALLNSVFSEQELAQGQKLLWRAGLAARETFTSDALRSLRSDEMPTAADCLTEYVNRCAGDEPSGQWFLRDAEGSGLGLQGVNLSDMFVGRRLDASAFPSFFLAQTGHDAVHEQLVADYLAWQAPWLLLLPGVDPVVRRQLEQQARCQPFVVEQQHRLYPAVADAAMIQAARVEAMLRQSQINQEETAGAMSTFYIELNPAGGNYT